MKKALIFILGLQMLPALIRADVSACTTLGQKADALLTNQLFAKLRAQCAQMTGGDPEGTADLTHNEISILWASTHKYPAVLTGYVAELSDQAAPVNYRLVLLQIAGMLRSTPVTSALESMASNEPNVMVRREAITELGAVGLPDVFNSLIQVWGTESDNEARARAVMSLGAIGNLAVWQQLRANLVAQWAKTAYQPLQSNGSPPILTAGQEAQLQSLFSNALDDRNYQVRIAAADAIAERHDSNLAWRLTLGLAKETKANRTPTANSPGIGIENKIVKIRLLNSLRRLHASNQEQALIAYLQGETDADVVATGLDVLGSLGSAASAAVILNYLASQDDFVAFHAALAAASLKQTQFLGYVKMRSFMARDSFAIQQMTEAANALAK